MTVPEALQISVRSSKWWNIRWELDTVLLSPWFPGRLEPGSCLRRMGLSLRVTE